MCQGSQRRAAGCYRQHSAGDPEKPRRFQAVLKAAAQTASFRFSVQLLVVEEELMRSGLPGVEIEPFQQVLAKRFFANAER